MGRTHRSRNPYDVLGVAADASDDEIKRAYRKLSKDTHPDLGGTSEAFAEVHSSYVILSDHQKRARFDRDGTVDDNPGNQFSAAVGICIAALMAECEGVARNGGDPKTQDMFRHVRQSITRQIGEFEAKKIHCENNVKNLRGLAKRIKSKKGKTNFLGRAVEEQANYTAQALDGIETDLDNHRAALAMLADHEFEQVGQEQLTRYTFFSMGTTGSGTNY